MPGAIPLVTATPTMIVHPTVFTQAAPAFRTNQGRILGAAYDAPNPWKDESQLSDFLIWCHQNQINDVTIASGKRILGKRHGDYCPVTCHDLTSADMALMFSWLKNNTSLSLGDTYRGEKKIFLNQDLLERLRLRVSIAHMTTSSAGMSITLRLIPNEIPTASSLAIPSDLVDAFRFKYGLGLICGKMESGKTWTQAAIIDDWISPDDCSIKIMHFGSPIEFLFDQHRGKDHITQHAVPDAIKSYPEALEILKSSTPDKGVIEEIKNANTMSMTLDTAESGIGISATLHISRVAGLPNTFLTYYPDPQERDARLYAAIDSMQVILVQRLEPAIVDGDPTKRKGRVCLREYLIFDEAMRSRIKMHPPHQWSDILNRLVHEAGTTMLQSARAYHAEGRLSDDQLTRIERGKA